MSKEDEAGVPPPPFLKPSASRYVEFQRKLERHERRCEEHWRDSYQNITTILHLITLVEDVSMRITTIIPYNADGITEFQEKIRNVMTLIIAASIQERLDVVAQGVDAIADFARRSPLWVTNEIFAQAIEYSSMPIFVLVKLCDALQRRKFVVPRALLTHIFYRIESWKHTNAELPGRVYGKGENRVSNLGFHSSKHLNSLTYLRHFKRNNVPMAFSIGVEHSVFVFRNGEIRFSGRERNVSGDEHSTAIVNNAMDENALTQMLQDIHEVIAGKDYTVYIRNDRRVYGVGCVPFRTKTGAVNKEWIKHSEITKGITNVDERTAIANELLKHHHERRIENDTPLLVKAADTGRTANVQIANNGHLRAVGDDVVQEVVPCSICGIFFNLTNVDWIAVTSTADVYVTLSHDAGNALYKGNFEELELAETPDWQTAEKKNPKKVGKSTKKEAPVRLMLKLEPVVGAENIDRVSVGPDGKNLVVTTFNKFRTYDKRVESRILATLPRVHFCFSPIYIQQNAHHLPTIEKNLAMFECMVGNFVNPVDERFAVPIQATENMQFRYGMLSIKLPSYYMFYDVKDEGSVLEQTMRYLNDLDEIFEEMRDVVRQHLERGFVCVSFDSGGGEEETKEKGIELEKKRFLRLLGRMACSLGLVVELYVEWTEPSKQLSFRLATWAPQAFKADKTLKIVCRGNAPIIDVPRSLWRDISTVIYATVRESGDTIKAPEETNAVSALEAVKFVNAPTRLTCASEATLFEVMEMADYLGMETLIRDTGEHLLYIATQEDINDIVHGLMNISQEEVVVYTLGRNPHILLNWQLNVPDELLYKICEVAQLHLGPVHRVGLSFNHATLGRAVGGPKQQRVMEYAAELRRLRRRGTRPNANDEVTVGSLPESAARRLLSEGFRPRDEQQREMFDRLFQESYEREKQIAASNAAEDDSEDAVIAVVREEMSDYMRAAIERLADWSAFDDINADMMRQLNNNVNRQVLVGRNMPLDRIFGDESLSRDEDVVQQPPDRLIMPDDDEGELLVMEEESHVVPSMAPFVNVHELEEQHRLGLLREREKGISTNVVRADTSPRRSQMEHTNGNAPPPWQSSPPSSSATSAPIPTRAPAASQVRLPWAPWGSPSLPNTDTGFTSNELPTLQEARNLRKPRGTKLSFNASSVASSPPSHWNAPGPSVPRSSPVFGIEPRTRSSNSLTEAAIPGRGRRRGFMGAARHQAAAFNPAALSFGEYDDQRWSGWQSPKNEERQMSFADIQRQQKDKQSAPRRRVVSMPNVLREESAIDYLVRYYEEQLPRSHHVEVRTTDRASLNPDTVSVTDPEQSEEPWCADNPLHKGTFDH